MYMDLSYLEVWQYCFFKKTISYRVLHLHFWKLRMIRLNSEVVHYLNKANLKEFSNLTLISLPDGELFRLNSMILAAFSSRGLSSNLVRTLSECQENSEDELVLITEFNKDELKILVNFCTEGILPLPLTKLQNDVPIQVSR